MNRTKIEYVDFTWNPIVGCKNGCWYCYAKRINDRFKILANWENPAFRTIELNAPLQLKKPSRILICSMGDMFGDWVPREWITAVLTVVKDLPQHTFLFLTKNPIRYAQFEFPGNCWLGVTATGFRDRMRAALMASSPKKNIKFLSYEPMLDMPSSYFFLMDWIIAGPMTGPGSQKHQPRVEWINYTLRVARTCKVPVFMKDALKKAWKGEFRREYPKEGK